MVRLAAICLGLLLAGCRPPETDTLVFAVPTAPGVLDPRLASDAASERVNALLYDRLVVLDERGAPQPGMARWQQIAPTHYRLTLRPERAPFWDGRQPAAADVVATYRSLRDPALGSPHAGALAHVERVAAIDDATVDFVLARPDPLFPSRLTIGIVPAAALADRNLAQAPLGSGPFAFEHWREDGSLVLRRRRDGQRVALVPVADPTMRALKLLRGEAQLLQNDLPSELYGYLSADRDLRVIERPGTTFAYIGFNLADPVLARREIRLAIAHAIDREAIITYLFGGRAQAAESVLRGEHWAGAAGLAPYAYDPDRARDLLRRAGYDERHPLVLSYKTSTDPFRVRIAHVFQSQLAEVGIQLQIASYDWGTFFGDIKAGRFQLYSLAWVGVNTPDILRYAFHSASLPPAGANRGRYRSPAVDALIERAELAEPAEAAALYVQVQQRVHDDLVYLPLWYESNVVASRGLDGYAPGRDGNYLALNTARLQHAAP
jgi:peptide/nickel transport system substrate-binding protein